MSELQDALVNGGGASVAIEASENYGADATRRVADGDVIRIRQDRVHGQDRAAPTEAVATRTWREVIRQRIQGRWRRGANHEVGVTGRVQVERVGRIGGEGQGAHGTGRNTARVNPSGQARVRTRSHEGTRIVNGNLVGRGAEGVGAEGQRTTRDGRRASVGIGAGEDHATLRREEAAAGADREVVRASEVGGDRQASTATTEAVGITGRGQYTGVSRVRRSTEHQARVTSEVQVLAAIASEGERTRGARRDLVRSEPSLRVGVSTRGVDGPRLVNLQRIVRGTRHRASREFGQAVMDLQGRAVLQGDRARVGNLTTDHRHDPRLGTLIEDAVVACDGGTEGNVVRTRQDDITAIDEGRCRGTERPCRVRGGLVFVRVDVVTADNSIGLVSAQDAREGRTITEDEEVRTTRLSDGTSAKQRATNLDIVTRGRATRVDNVRSNIGGDVAIPDHIGVLVVQRTAIIDHNAGVVAGDGRVEVQLTAIIDGDGLTRALTKVGGGFNRELAAINDDITDVSHGGDVGDLGEARAGLSQREAAHVQEAVVAGTLVKEVKAVRATHRRVACET